MNSQIKIGAALSYISLLISLIIGLLYTPFMLSHMGQSEYGLFNLSASITTYLTILDTGFASGVIRYLSYYLGCGDCQKQKEVISTSLVLYLFLGVLCFFLGCILYFNLDNLYGTSLTPSELQNLKIIIMLLVCYLSFQMPASVFLSIVTAYEQFTLLKSLKLLYAILNPLIMSPLLLMGYKSIAMTLVGMSLGVVSSICYFVYTVKKLNVKVTIENFNKGILNQLFRFSVPMLLIMACDGLCRSFGAFYIGSVHGTVSVTILSLAIQMRGYIESFVRAITSLFLPSFTKQVAINIDHKSLSAQFISISRIELHIALLLVSGLFVFGSQFYLFWTRGVNSDEVYISSLIILVPLILPLSESVGEELIKAYNVQKYQMYIYCCRAFIVIGVSVAFSEIYGFYACAAAISLAAFICDTILLNCVYKRILNIQVEVFLKGCIFPILISFAIAVISFFIIKNISNWILAVVPFFCFYAVIYYYIILNAYEKSIVNSIIFRVYERIFAKY